MKTIKLLDNNKKPTKGKLINYDEHFIKKLQENPKQLEDYRKFIVEEFQKDQNKELLLDGLKTIAMATQGMTKVAKKVDVGRNSLHKMLSKKGNPSLENFIYIAHCLNFNLTLSEIKPSKKCSA